MTRKTICAVAQLGPIARAGTRRSAATRGAGLVVFPELALTSFFPRWWMEDAAEIDAWFETGMPSVDTRPLFETAADLGIGFHLGYAELTPDGRRSNTAILVNARGAIVGKYRKIHLPGHANHKPGRPFQQLDKRYFEIGDLGFRVFDAFGGRAATCICNDRRWAETWRALGLGGAEMVALGYNTPAHYPPAPGHDHLQHFHNALSIQAGCYQNSLWALAAAKAGPEEGCDLIGGSLIVAQTGEIAAQAATVEDVVMTATVDLDRCAEIRRNIFNFAEHRQPDRYGAHTAPD